MHICPRDSCRQHHLMQRVHGCKIRKIFLRDSQREVSSGSGNDSGAQCHPVKENHNWRNPKFVTHGHGEADVPATSRGSCESSHIASNLIRVSLVAGPGAPGDQLNFRLPPRSTGGHLNDCQCQQCQQDVFRPNRLIKPSHKNRRTIRAAHAPTSKANTKEVERRSTH